MVVIECDDPNNPGTKCYIAEDDVWPTQILQRAHVFIEKGDEKDFDWPSEQADARRLVSDLKRHNAKIIKVKNCDVCASVKFLTEPCPICGAN